SLENYSSSSSLPDCWQQGGSGTNTYTWSKTADAASGNWAENVAISSYKSGSRILVMSQKTNACAPRITAGSTYKLSAWYKSDQPVRFVVYYKADNGAWIWWTQSPKFNASSTWAQAQWTTPALPAGATALSFGLSLFSAGSLTTDNYSMTATP